MGECGTLRTTFLVFLILYNFLPGDEARRIAKRRRVGENDLMEMLMVRKDAFARPVQKASEAVTVYHGITLIKIKRMNEDVGWITTNIWETLTWSDSNLQWDPESYNNISAVRIPIHRIWTPDIYPLNNLDQFYEPAFRTKATVHPTGGVTVTANYMLSSTCEFKQDTAEQNCELNFGSWAYSDSELNLMMEREDGADLSEYIPHKEWDLLGVPSVRTVNASSPESSTGITYNLKIKRRTTSP